MQLRKKGVALVASLALLVVTAGVLALIFSSTMRDINHGANDAAIIKSLMLARGGATLGAKILQGPIKEELNLIVQDTANTVGMWQFGTSSLGSSVTRPTPESAMSDLEIVSELLQPKIDALLCNKTITPNGGTERVTILVFVTDKACGGSIGLPNKVNLQGGRFVEGSGRTYSIPYVMVSEAKVGDYKRNIVVQGEYQFRVGGDKFSKYALFTDEHKTSDGSDIWFTDSTLFDGPVHTNGNFKFYREPWFGGQVTSAGFKNPHNTPVPDPQNPPSGGNPGADYWGIGFKDDTALAVSTTYTDSSSGITTSPSFAGGVDWHSSYVKLPDNAFDQRHYARKNGIDLSDDLGSDDIGKITMWASDAECSVNPINPLTSNGSGGWTTNSTVQCIEACDTGNPANCILYKIADRKLYRDGVLVTKPREYFNGVIYVNGEVGQLSGPKRVPANSTDSADAPPAFASFSELTLAAKNSVRITGDLKYENPPCTGYPTRQPDNSVTPSVCNNINVRNVFGIFVPDGDILIGNNHSIAGLNAPDNVAIHGSLMASSGVVTVEDYESGSPRGDVHLLGGLIEYNYGGFGTFDGATGAYKSGFGRKFAYDTRFSMQLAPPRFPGTDMATVEGVFTFSLGQREQVY